MLSQNNNQQKKQGQKKNIITIKHCDSLPTVDDSCAVELETLLIGKRNQMKWQCTFLVSINGMYSLFSFSSTINKQISCPISNAGSTTFVFTETDICYVQSSIEIASNIQLTEISAECGLIVN